MGREFCSSEGSQAKDENQSKFCIYRFSPYRAVNTPRLCYKNDVVMDNNLWVCSGFRRRVSEIFALLSC